MMNLRHAFILTRKDLLEIKNEKATVITLFLFPTIFSIFFPSLILFFGTKNVFVNSIGGLNAFLDKMPSKFVISGLNQGTEPIYALLMYFFIPLFLLIPIMISTVIASSSFVGEKEKKTIEGLLYTPLTNSELILGKILAAAIPAMLITWGSLLIYGILLDTIGYRLFGKIVFPNENWLIVGFLLEPLIVFLSISLVVLVSQRAKTSKSAQSVAMILILPLIGALISQSSGILIFGTWFSLVLCGILFLIDIILFVTISKRFDRETFILKI